jgi:hypothetical protein
MAKCLKNKITGEIKRFTERNQKEINKIIELIKTDTWFYVPKNEWKKLKPEPKKKEKKDIKNKDKNI